MNQNDIVDIDNFQKSLNGQNITNQNSSTTTNTKEVVNIPTNITNMDIVVPQNVLYSTQNTKTIGDVALEQALATLSRQTSPFVATSLNTTRYKKDYIIMNINDKKSQILRYGIFALFLNTLTYVVTTTTKQDLDKVIITYSTSSYDPTQIVDIAYKYQTSTDRSLIQKSIAKELKNPEILQNTIIISNIDPVLMNLNIIIKNKTYMSTTDFNTLNAFITIMMSF